MRRWMRVEVSTVNSETKQTNIESRSPFLQDEDRILMVSRNHDTM